MRINSPVRNHIARLLHELDISIDAIPDAESVPTDRIPSRYLPRICALCGMSSRGVYEVMGLDDDAFEQFLMDRFRPRPLEGDGQPSPGAEAVTEVEALAAEDEEAA
jgi:hypothetical protein